MIGTGCHAEIFRLDREMANGQTLNTLRSKVLKFKAILSRHPGNEIMPGEGPLVVRTHLSMVGEVHV